MRCDYCGNEIDRNTGKCVSCGRMWGNDVESVINAWEPHRTDTDIRPVPRQAERPVYPAPEMNQRAGKGKEEGSHNALAIFALILSIILLAVLIVSLITTGGKIKKLNQAQQDLEESFRGMNEKLRDLDKELKDVLTTGAVPSAGSGEPAAPAGIGTEPESSDSENSAPENGPVLSGQENTPPEGQTDEDSAAENSHPDNVPSGEDDLSENVPADEGDSGEHGAPYDRDDGYNQNIPSERA